MYCVYIKSYKQVTDEINIILLVFVTLKTVLLQNVRHWILFEHYYKIKLVINSAVVK